MCKRKNNLKYNIFERLCATYKFGVAGFGVGVAVAIVLYLDGNLLPAVFTQPLIAEILIPCLRDNSVGDISSSVTCATMAFLSSFEKSLAVLLGLLTGIVEDVIGLLSTLLEGSVVLFLSMISFFHLVNVSPGANCERD